MDTKKIVQDLLERGAHYGFTKNRRHPSMVGSIISTRNKNDLIDLDQTATQIAAAIEIVKGLAAGGKSILIVGTKAESLDAVTMASSRMPALYVKNRWVGGIITNFSEIKKRITRLITLRDEKSQGLLEKYTKKERILIDREMDKMEKNFGGLVDMKRIPDMVIVVDSGKEHIAVTEAQKMQIPVMGILNTDCDFKAVNYPIVMNDTSKAAIEYVMAALAEAYFTAKA